MSYSKLGFHIQLASRMAEYDNLMGELRPAVIVGVGSQEQLAKLADYYSVTGEVTKYVHRDIVYEERVLNAQKGVADPVASAEAFYRNVVANAPNWAYVQAFNEADEDFEWLDAFWEKLVQLCKQNGKRCIVGNYATGNPEPNEWALLKNTLAAVNEVGPNVAVVGLHEYGFNGSMTSMLGFRIGRYIDLKSYCKLQGFNNVKLIINEYGLDEPGYQELGISPEQYADDLIFIDERIYSPDDFILGAAIYDLSLLADEYNLVKLEAKGRNEEGLNLVAFRIKSAQKPIPNPEPEPEPEPDPEPPPVKFIATDSFEGIFVPIDPVGDKRMPHGWEIEERGESNHHVEAEYDKRMVSHGNQAVRVWTGYEKHNSILLRQFDVSANADIEVSVDAKLWSASSDDAHDPFSESTGAMIAFLGVDTTGGVDSRADTVEWVQTEKLDAFTPLAIKTKTKSNKLTVFLRAFGKYLMARNDVRWDNLVISGVGTVPTPDPEPEPLPEITDYLVRIKATSLNIREQPNTAASVKGSLPQGTIVAVYSLWQGWYLLKGTQFYIKQEFTERV